MFDESDLVDAKGRYLHWDELRRRAPKGVDPRDVWTITKFHRSGLLKQIELKAGNDAPFKYCVPDAAQRVLHTIDGLRSPILTADSGVGGTREENDRFLVESLMMEEAIASAQLEGAATTRRVAKEMLESERPPRNEHERMIVNNFLLMKQAKQCKDEALSVDLLLRFHETATQQTIDPYVIPGQLRTSDDVYVVDSEGGIAHQPPRAEWLPARLERLCQFAAEKHDGEDGRPFIHPAVKAIILHFMIGYEHPFVDGNGRTARALFYWYMLKTGYWPFEFISISALLKVAATAYGKAYLYTETDDFDLTYFIDYQLQIIQRAVDNFLKYIEKKRREQFELMVWLDEVGISGKLNYRQGQLLRKVLQHPGRVFHVKEVKNDFGVAENTARADLEKLVKLKVLAAAKDGKFIQYVARADASEHLRKGS